MPEVIQVRNLAERSCDGLNIGLWWVVGSVATYVTVEDQKAGDDPIRLTIDVPKGVSPNDVFKHPFAYQADQLTAPKDKYDTGVRDGRGME